MKDENPRPNGPRPGNGSPDPETVLASRRARAPQGTSIGAYAGVGFQFAAAIIVFLYVGQWIDRRLGTAPIFLLIGVFVGGSAAFYSMYRHLMAAQAREEADRLARRDAGEDSKGTGNSGGSTR
jgi:F0F1-type ATP synthase assembly protein I